MYYHWSLLLFAVTGVSWFHKMWAPGALCLILWSPGTLLSLIKVLQLSNSVTCPLLLLLFTYQAPMNGPGNEASTLHELVRFAALLVCLLIDNTYIIMVYFIRWSSKKHHLLHVNTTALHSQSRFKCLTWVYAWLPAWCPRTSVHSWSAYLAVLARVSSS